MSLRIFHIVFVAVCVVLCTFVAAWGIRNYMATRESASLIIGIASLISGFGLVFYGVRVYGKLKDLS
jgi:hypothetical protein